MGLAGFLRRLASRVCVAGSRYHAVLRITIVCPVAHWQTPDLHFEVAPALFSGDLVTRRVSEAKNVPLFFLAYAARFQKSATSKDLQRDGCRSGGESVVLLVRCVWVVAAAVGKPGVRGMSDGIGQVVMRGCRW